MLLPIPARLRRLGFATATTSRLAPPLGFLRHQATRQIAYRLLNMWNTMVPPSRKLQPLHISLCVQKS
jgi:hypothetical protein